MNETLLLIEGVHKAYTLRKKVIQVLTGADLEVRGGEKVAIIGKSGAGKSTLLHILGGLDDPDSGVVKIAGQDFYALAQSQRAAIRASSIGFIFQSYHLLPELNVTENVMLPAMALGGFATGPREPLRTRAEELLRTVGLGDRMNHTPLELSGGEQQRVAMARALMNDPQLILADEPTGNLDSATGGQILQILFSLNKTRGSTIVLVTHNEELARTCDRVLGLKEGKLVPA
ncbi:MAG: hypothetical protein C0404_12715 [Verrucomicrobia bacterium]|nr:hypothetical protein [Verrucomicrobiota bacterium]